MIDMGSSYLIWALITWYGLWSLDKGYDNLTDHFIPIRWSRLSL